MIDKKHSRYFEVLMNNLVKMLDENLEYYDHLVEGDTLYITVFSNRKEVSCPFCGTVSTKTHSLYQKSFQDLPIQDKKVIIRLMNRKLFCQNSSCGRKTFAERFEFIDFKAKKTHRLEHKIREIALNCSTISASNTLRRNTVDVSRTTISNLLKKQN